MTVESVTAQVDTSSREPQVWNSADQEKPVRPVAFFWLVVFKKRMIYPLVNVYITNWKVLPCLMGKSWKIHYFDWAIFQFAFCMFLLVITRGYGMSYDVILVPHWRFIYFSWWNCTTNSPGSETSGGSSGTQLLSLLTSKVAQKSDGFLDASKPAHFTGFSAIKWMAAVIKKAIEATFW